MLLVYVKVNSDGNDMTQVNLKQTCSIKIILYFCFLLWYEWGTKKQLDCRQKKNPSHKSKSEKLGLS